MAIISNLFGESPFGALEAHGEKVYACVQLLKQFFVAFNEGNADKLKETSDKIFALETEADKIRNHLHERLTSKALMALSKEELFNILEQQDSIADRAEDIVATLTYREMKLPADLMDEVALFLDRILRNCELAAGIMSKMDILVEASFSGRDAFSVSRLIIELSEREDATKLAQINLSRKLMAAGDVIPPVETMLWLQVIGYIADLSKFADRVANGVHLTLKIK